MGSSSSTKMMRIRNETEKMLDWRRSWDVADAVVDADDESGRGAVVVGLMEFADVVVDVDVRRRIPVSWLLSVDESRMDGSPPKSG